jgi:hypothetical protein
MGLVSIGGFVRDSIKQICHMLNVDFRSQWAEHNLGGVRVG